MKALIKKLLRESLQKLDNTLSDYDTIFPLAGSQVDGMSVRDSVPNTSSIGASLTEYVVLKGIREISFGQFSDLPPLTFHSRSDKERSEILAGQVNNSDEINPLIVVVDGEGLYVLEGAHRFDALRLLKKKSFPALVVIDKEKSLNENSNSNLSGTKIVDKAGDPLVVYRAQSDDRKQGADRQSNHKGIYFSADKDSVKIYGDIIKPYYLNIKNPIVLKDDEWNLSVIPDYYYKYLIGKGYDGGVWLRHGVMYEIVAFHPEQVIPADSLNERYQHDVEKENARLETLFQEGNKYFPGLKMSTMAVDGATEPQMRFFIPQEDRWTSVGGFEVHLAGAKIKKIAEWLNSKHIQMVWSKTTNSIYVQGRSQEVRISDHRKGKHQGTDILVRWNTPLLEIMNAVYDLVKIQ